MLKKKKCSKNDGRTSEGHRIQLAGAPTDQIWDNYSTNMKERERERQRGKERGREGVRKGGRERKLK